MTHNKKPLVVDLDGTLIRTDILLESFMLLVRENPLVLFLMPFWLLRGKANLKAQIARRVEVPVAYLPYHDALLDYIRHERGSGREIVLATASNRRYAEAIADHLGVFDAVFASDDTRNLAGDGKRDVLTERYGEGGYVYAANHSVDLKVWRHCDRAIVVGDAALAGKAEAMCGLEKHFVVQRPGVKTLIKALRVHQWVKNALIFVPLMTAHQIANPGLIWQCVLAFLAFSVCASSVYFLNDLLDLNDDRQHATTKNRPFAAGTLSLSVGILGAPLLLLAAVLACFFLPPEFRLVLLVYYGLTLAYSFKLKRLVMVDVVTLASLYTIRIVAGAAAIDVRLSFWLLSFSVFVFLSLAIIKRYSELMKLKAMNATKALGRGYQVEDLELLSSLGGASGYLSVLVLALYINSPEVQGMYSNPVLMWPACLVMLYWVSRIWIIAHRGNMDDDPIVFALKDRASVIAGALIVGFMLLAV